MGVEAGMDAGSWRFETGKTTILLMLSWSIQPLASSFSTSLHNLTSSSIAQRQRSLRNRKWISAFGQRYRGALGKSVFGIRLPCLPPLG